jgi:hypothetical protein
MSRIQVYIHRNKRHKSEYAHFIVNCLCIASSPQTNCDIENSGLVD